MLIAISLQNGFNPSVPLGVEVDCSQAFGKGGATPRIDRAAIPSLGELQRDHRRRPRRTEEDVAEVQDRKIAAPPLRPLARSRLLPHAAAPATILLASGYANGAAYEYKKEHTSKARRHSFG